MERWDKAPKVLFDVSDSLICMLKDFGDQRVRRSVHHVQRGNDAGIQPPPQRFQ
jgi:hypothetical protein